MDWAAVIPVIIGAVLGGGASIATTLLTLRHQARLERDRQAHQARLELDKRVQERERAALGQAREAIAKLMRLEDKPREAWKIRPPAEDISSKEHFAEKKLLRELHQAWKAKRDDALLDLEMAIGDFSDDGVRVMLDDVCALIRYADFLSNHIRAVESETRRAACYKGRECLARFSQGRPLPSVEGFYGQALETVRNWFEEQDHVAEIQEEEGQGRALEAEKKFMETLPKGESIPEANP